MQKITSNKKIAIFGDSYAESVGSIPAIGWVKKLESMDKTWQIKNFAKIGSSLWWSYKKFCKNFNAYDVVVFVVTQHGRLSIDDCHVCTLFNLYNDPFRSPELKTLQKQYPGIIESLKHYFLVVQDEQQELFLHNQLVQDIKSKCKEKDKQLIIIPGFDSSLHHQSIFKTSLYDVTLNEIEVATGKKKFVYETGFRANHLSEKNNQILANIVYNIIKGTCTNVDLDDFVYETYTDLTKYWRI